MSTQLYTTAINNGDLKGHGNYVVPFLCSLKQQLRYIETKISCQLINVMARASAPPNIPTVTINAAMVEETGTQCCTVCTGNHTNLMKCPQFPSFIPGPGARTLPDTVFPSCLKCAGNTEQCHQFNVNYMCSKTSKNQLLCIECKTHEKKQAWYKNHFNPSLGFKNVLLC